MKILLAIVEKYVSTGEPVGSKTICEDSHLSFSSATIRSEMANLVNFGYLTQPHISSGRVPSHKGYRLYINKLMNEKPIPKEEINFINGELSTAAPEPESILETAVKVLADITGFTAVLTTPLNQTSHIRNIKFVQIGRRSAMLVLTTSGGMVKNKLFRCDYDLSAEILKFLEKILEEKFCGKLLNRVNCETLDILVSGDKETAFFLLPVVDVFLQAVKEACEVKIKMSGQKNLLCIPGITAETVVDIFNFLEDENKVLNLFGGTKYGVNFVVGEENIYGQLKNASVLSTSYSIGDKFGALGVIGPTRMDYGGVSSRLRYVASLVGLFLERMLHND